MLLGVDYYPEQWDSAIMEADMDRILELGCNVIRIGEFAWHHMEPEEGKFDFSTLTGSLIWPRGKVFRSFSVPPPPRPLPG